MELTIAESLLLLALDDAKGSAGSTYLDPGLVGALLVDLGRSGALRAEGKVLHPVPGTTPGHPVLARAYVAITESPKPRTAKSWVGRLPRELKPLRETVATPLVQRGVLSENRGTFLGLFSNVRYPQADPGPEQQLRSRLHEVLLAGRAPTEQDALLLGLLGPLNLLGSLVGRSDRRQARKRAKEIAEQGIAGSAVADAVRDINAAVLAAVIIPAATAGGSS